mmetsp:Transcript_28498/g.64767  ORF Transcript_28498/g.64767 Transcript_28498/m.64767 type:complete len:243 (+) Transcript_28498:1400-2128(+)
MGLLIVTTNAQRTRRRSSLAGAGAAWKIHQRVPAVQHHLQASSTRPALGPAWVMAQTGTPTVMGSQIAKTGAGTTRSRLSLVLVAVGWLMRTVTWTGWLIATTNVRTTPARPQLLESVDAARPTSTATSTGYPTAWTSVRGTSTRWSLAGVAAARRRLWTRMVNRSACSGLRRKEAPWASSVHGSPATRLSTDSRRSMAAIAWASGTWWVLRTTDALWPRSTTSPSVPSPPHALADGCWTAQ